MTPTIQSLGLDKLPCEDRLAIARALFESVSAEGLPLPMSDARRRELQRRADEDDADPEGGIPWEQVRAEARARFLS
jgi:putative addiction module component (TIGR02574 family)